MVKMRSSLTLALWQRHQVPSNHEYYISQPTQHVNFPHKITQSKWMVQADQQSLLLP